MQIPSVTEKLQAQLIQGTKPGSDKPTVTSQEENDQDQVQNAIDPDSTRSGKGQNFDTNG